MEKRPPLTQEEKERIYWGKLKGQTLLELAAEVKCGVECARKWWRVGRDKGLEGLRAARRGRGDTGTLAQFKPRVAEQALEYKRAHRRWGPNRVMVELEQHPDFKDARLPGPSRLATFFKERCPECVGERKPRPEPAPRLPKANGVHEVWQLDSQEKISLANGEVATICNIRDPVGAAMIASHAFSVKTALHWRKLEWTEVRQVIREAGAEWQTLPDAIQTDNELGLAGGPNDPFPGPLTLWLAGLGVRHGFIRPGCPTDQPEIERNHQTLDYWTLSEEDRADLPHLQCGLNRERKVYNHWFPSRASDCAGRPPLTAHPELLQPRHVYQPEWELALFDMQRVYDCLATFTFKRKVNASAQVSLGRRMYSLGKKLVRNRGIETVIVRFDPLDRHWVFSTQAEEELVRRPLKGLDAQTLTGLDPHTIQISLPIQLPLPFLVA
jgi:transposase InsO family protein